VGNGDYKYLSKGKKKVLQVLLCIQGECVTQRSTQLNQQNESFCVSREKLLISGDIESNPSAIRSTLAFY